MSTERSEASSRPSFSHELRSPLNHIIGYSETLIEEAEDANETQLVAPLQAILGTGRQLLTLVNDIFSAERADERKAHLRTMLGDLIPVAHAVAAQIELLLNENGDTETLIKDLHKIQGPVVRLLDLIERADESWAPGKAPATQQPVPDHEPKQTPQTGVEKQAAERGILLVVDDNAQNREVLSRHLQRQGYYVVTAENGRQAIEMMSSAPFDLLLLDILMPEMDGYEVLRHLKQDKAFSHIPVIMISALDEIESVVRCIEMGAEDYLPKPFNPVLLRARIGASLEKKRLRDKDIQYLEQVAILTGAAAAVEAGTFDSRTLADVAQRSDALGNLARIFQHMAREIYEREQKLKQEVQELRIEIDNAKRDRHVNEITDSEYFRPLQDKASRMRKNLDHEPPEDK